MSSNYDVTISLLRDATKLVKRDIHASETEPNHSLQIIVLNREYLSKSDWLKNVQYKPFWFEEN